MNSTNLSHKYLTIALLSMCSMLISYTQSIAGPQSHPMGLPRLDGLPSKTGEVPIPRDALEVIDLAHIDARPQRTTWTKTQGPLTYVEVPSHARYEILLRNSQNSPCYVTFAINASIGTEIYIGGTILGIAATIGDDMYATLMRNDSTLGASEWTSLGYQTQMLPFGGAIMASFAPVTVKVDPVGQSWSLWIADDLVASSVRLTSEALDLMFVVKTGPTAAWLWGIARSAENPLFADTNHNTVPDEFERTVMGGLQTSADGSDTNDVLSQLWREEKRSRLPSRFNLTMPAPDFIPDLCGPEGVAFLHNMPNAYIFRTSNQ